MRCAEGREFIAEVEQALTDPPAPIPRDVAGWAERAEEFEAALRDTRAAKDSLSVVYLDHCAQLSGGELALLRLLPALRGVDSHVILAEDGPLRSRLEDAGARCEVLTMSERARSVRRAEIGAVALRARVVLDTARYVLRLRARLRDLAPDLVHTNSLKAGVYGSVAARLAGIPVVWHVRDRIASDYLPAPLVPILRALIRRLPDAVVTNSKATLDCLRWKAPAGPSGPRASIVASPVMSHPVITEASSSHPRVDRPFAVGLIGRIAPWKGQDVFLRAFHAAFPNGDEVARIVGSAMFGEELFLEQLHSLVTEMGLGDRVTFTGFVDPVEPQLRELDVVVHASVIPEPFGQVVVEALAAGVPVVATAAGGPLEIIDDEECGLLYPPGDVDRLAAALRRLRDDEALRKRLAANGLLRAQQFTPEAVAVKMLAVYRQVLEGGPDRPRLASTE